MNNIINVIITILTMVGLMPIKRELDLIPMPMGWGEEGYEGPLLTSFKDGLRREGHVVYTTVTLEHWALSASYMEDLEEGAEAFANDAKWAYYGAFVKGSYATQIEALNTNLHWVNQSTWAYLALVVGKPMGGMDVFGRIPTRSTGVMTPRFFN